MTDKKQIIIDGEKVDCEILFRCKHIDDLAAYNMIRNRIKITPENAPIGDFELMLIENTDSPFGFSFVCKRNNKGDVWEYSGFGHSGACSIVTALLKQLARKTQECEELKRNNQILCDLYKNVDSCLQKRTEKFDCYLKALEEIEQHFEHRCDICRDNYGLGADCSVCWHKDIKNIISRAKRGK